MENRIVFFCCLKEGNNPSNISSVRIFHSSLKEAPQSGNANVTEHTLRAHRTQTRDQLRPNPKLIDKRV